MNQIGYEKEWLHFLDMYVRPLQEAAYAGYFQKVKINTEYLFYFLCFFTSFLYIGTLLEIILLK